MDNLELQLKDIDRKIQEIKDFIDSSGIDLSGEYEVLEQKRQQIKKAIFENMSAYQRVQIARHKDRPNYSDYINGMIGNFIELHGDRSFRDDPAIVGGIGYLNDIPVTIISLAKGKDTNENLARNFGAAHPEGYRKALRLMKQAEKFNRPVICLIDTSGAYSGIGAEERGQGEAIARNLFDMSDLKTPIISIVIGEGGSGGALALGVADIVIMLENSIYSVISPEGCASILYKDASKAQEAAKYLKLTAQDLLNLGIIDKIIKEPLGGAHNDVSGTVQSLKDAIYDELKKLIMVDINDITDLRYQKIRSRGRYLENSSNMS